MSKISIILIFLLFSCVSKMDRDNLPCAKDKLPNVHVDQVKSKDSYHSEYGYFFINEFNKIARNQNAENEYSIDISFRYKIKNPIMQKTASNVTMSYGLSVKYKLIESKSGNAVMQNKFYVDSVRYLLQSEYDNYDEMDKVMSNLAVESAKRVASEIAMHFKCEK